MSFGTNSFPLRTKSVHSKRSIKHPAFEDSDSEDDTGMTKAMQFQVLLRKEAQRQELNTIPPVVPECAPAKLLNAIPSPFKHLHLPHLPHFHNENKAQFLIVNNEAIPPPPKRAPPLPPPTGPLPPPPLSPPSYASPSIATPDIEVPMPSPEPRPASASPPQERTRRYSVAEVAPAYADTTSHSKEVLLSRKHRSFDFEESMNTDNQALPQELEPQPQQYISIPASNHASSSWSGPTESTRATFIQDRPPSIVTPEASESFATPFSPTIITGHVDPPLGLFRFEKPKLELRTEDLPPNYSGEWTPQKPQPRSAVVKEQRDKLRKPSSRDISSRDIKISAPASLDNATNFVDFQTEPPRTAPLPPSSATSPAGTLKNASSTLPVSSIISQELRANTGGFSEVSRTDSTGPSNGPARKAPKFRTVAKVAGRLLRHQSQPPQTPSRLIQRPSLPPLLYSASTPIEQHILAISARVKDEFKMKLKSRNELELPLVDAATEEELIQQLQDVNEEIGRCAKELARLLHRSSTERRERRSVMAKKTLGIQSDVRTNLNNFLVTRVFRPFSIQINEEDDEAVRDRYEEIAPSVPQFIASRWRVIASASTSRPIQELGPVLASLAADATLAILRDRSSDAELTQETTALLIPLIRHAYLLAHFNRLEMLTTDYDVFFGTELGGWMVLSQEEEKHTNHHSKTQDSRVSGHCSLGLRKKRYVGEGAFQRRVWDVLLKAQVLTSAPLPN